jgi:hypothetical protein
VSTNQNPTKIPLEFCGLQKMPGGWMPLWNLLQPIDGHSERSTVSERTLVQKGFYAPDPTGLKRGDIVDL